jgi:putative hydrolase of the HAD superfamily
MGTIDIVKKLKENGFSVYILSNIGPAHFSLLRQKYPEIFALFNGWYTPTPENNFSHKPHAKFYQGFKQYILKKEGKDKQIIFTDDSRKYIKGACKEGYIAIQFTTPEKLKDFLEQLEQHALLCP